MTTKPGPLVPLPAARPGDVLRSLLFYPVFYGLSFGLVLLIPVMLLGPRARILWWCTKWSHLQRWCIEHIMGITVKVEGPVPAGAVLVALKHESFFEAIDLPTLLHFPVVFAKVELMRLPIWGTAARAYGLIEVQRDQGAKALRAMVSAARAVSAEGRPICIFPEGTRVPHGERPPLQSGFAGLYKLLGLPVVPAAVLSGPCYHRWIKRKGTITIRFGETIPPGLPREEAEALVHTAINALNPPVV